MERCTLAVVASMDSSSSSKKELDALMMAIHRCNMERCVPEQVASIMDIGTSIKKKLDALMMALP